MRKRLDFDEVRKIGLAFPGVEEGTMYGTPALKFRGKMLACIPIHRSAEPGSVAVSVDFERRRELLETAPDVYYAPEHYANYPTVLVRMARIEPDALRDLLGMAYKFVSAKKRGKKLLVLIALVCLGTAARAQSPALGVNISRGFVYTCPAVGDATCAPNVQYSAIAAYAYTDAQGNRTPFANWVRDVALPGLTASNLAFLRMFFSPGTDVACTGCGYAGASISSLPYLLPRGSPYLNGRSFATRSEPRLQPWVYTNLELFFRDVAAARLAVDLVLDWDENYAYWDEAPGDGGFVGLPALYEAWQNAADALVRSGAQVMQIEPSQEQQLFQTQVEQRSVSLESRTGWIYSRVIPGGEWGTRPKGAAQADLLDSTLGPLQQRFPDLAGRIFPGLEMRGAAGFCNIQTYNNWGVAPWPVTDVAGYYDYLTARRANPAFPYPLQYPVLLNFHRYVALDLNANVMETPADVTNSFNDLYAFHSGDSPAAFTACAGRWTSPIPWGHAPWVIFGESNSAAVTSWGALGLMTQGYANSRLQQWEGGGYNHSVVMPWFYGYGADRWSPSETSQNIFGSGASTGVLRVSQPAATTFAAPILYRDKQSLRMAASPGGSPDPQTVTIQNQGSGALQFSIAVDPSSSWLQVSPASGTLNSGEAVTLTVSAASAALAEGAYSGSFTISGTNAGANADDAPASIAVALNVSSAVITEPSRLDIFVPPGTATTRDLYLPMQSIANAAFPGWTVKTDSGNWLAVKLRPERGVVLEAQIAPLSEGVYHGSIAFDYRGQNAGTVPVTLTATSKPILTSDPGQLTIDAAAGVPVETRWINVTNAGMGQLTWTVSADAPWLKVVVDANSSAKIAADTTGLLPGTYTGTVRITSAGAANGSVAIPVTLRLAAQGPPHVTPGAVVDAASFCVAGHCFLAPGEIATVFGQQLSYPGATTRALVNGVVAEVFYADFHQVNFRVPAELSPTAAGRLLVQVERGGLLSDTVSVGFTSSAPAIFAAARDSGDYISIYATGLGGSAPTVLFTGPGIVGNLEVKPSYAGPAPGFDGLDQINVEVPLGAVRVELRSPLNLISNAIDVPPSAVSARQIPNVRYLRWSTASGITCKCTTYSKVLPEYSK